MVFRGTYLAGLQRAFDRGELRLTGSLAPFVAPAAFTAWLGVLRRQAWVVYCKPPFAGPGHVLAYLARYTHRVALSNDRLVALDGDRVRFRWRDYADGDRTKVLALDAPEFLRRFLLHIVPDGFVRIRHFGLLANRHRAVHLARCRTLLAQAPLPPREPPESVRAVMLRVTGIDIDLCPVCHLGRVAAGRTPVACPFGVGHLVTRRCAITLLASGPSHGSALRTRLRQRHRRGHRGDAEPAHTLALPPAGALAPQRRLRRRSVSPLAPVSQRLHQR